MAPLSFLQRNSSRASISTILLNKILSFKKGNCVKQLTHFTFTVLLLAGGLGVESVWAQQARRYNGPRVDYDFQNQAPGRFVSCDVFENTNQPQHFQTCQFATAEGRRMAEIFAGQEGRIEGYQRGYAWGLNQGIDLNIANTAQIRRGASELHYYEHKLAIADEIGIDRGEEDATPLAEQEVRSRFNNAVNSGAMPSDSFQVPTSHYNGEQNAFTRFVGQVPDVQDVIRRERYNEHLIVYRDFDRTYRDSPATRRRIVDLYSNDGIYRPVFSRYSNGDEIINIWLNRRIDSYSRYDRLNQNAPRASDGTLETDFQEMFRVIFVRAYNHYARYSFSRNFNEALDLGFWQGEDTGLEIGAEVARARGLQQAFDQEFRVRSINSYKDRFHASYAESFRSTYDDYRNNAKLSIELLELIGADADGIIQPGERVAMKFKVVNSGGAASDLRISAQGDVVNGTTAQKQIAALKSEVFTTDMLATVNPALGNRAQANITLNVNGMTDTIGTNVSYLVQLTAQSASLNTLRGSAMVNVNAENVATITTPRPIKAVLTIAGKTFEALGTTLSPGQVQKLAVDVQGLDPYTLLTANITGQLQLKLGDQVIETRNVILTSNNRTADAVEYFDQLANGRGILPAGIGNGTQTQKVLNLLVSLNDVETDNNSGRGGYNMYRRSIDSTIVGQVRSAKLRNEQSEEALEHYRRLGNVLMKARKKFKSFLWVAPKRKHYTKIVEEII